MSDFPFFELMMTSPGVQLTAIVLISEMCILTPDVISHFRRYVPNLVRSLKSLIQAGYSPEHDVNGISDPFLQVHILRLLRLLGHKDMDSSETMNDLLAQVATNTETTKNVGNSVLYETVLTIMDIKSESGLRVLAINILGRFLLNNDKNIRYVALNTLLKTLKIDNSAVQRHRSTVLECLKDPDVSIKRRAIELSFALVNTSNIRSMMKELISFLEKSDVDFKQYTASNIITVAEKFAPNKRWHIDTILKVLTTASGYVRDDAVTKLIQLVSNTESLHTYTVQHLFRAIQDDKSQQVLVQVASWCIGEYGELLLSTDLEEDEPLDVTESDVVDLLSTVLNSILSSQVTKEFALTAIMKLTTRFTTCNDQIQLIINNYTTNTDVELQQRSVEYDAIFRKFEPLRPGLLERMPLISSEPSPSDGPDEGALDMNGDAKASELSNTLVDSSSSTNSSTPQVGQKKESDSLFDLLGDGLPSAQPMAPGSAPSSGGGGLMDLLGDLDMGVGATPVAMPQPMSSSGMNSSSGMGGGLDDLLGLSDGSGVGVGGGLNDFSAPSAVSTGHPPITAFEKNGLKIMFSFGDVNSQGAGSFVTKMSATNSQSSAMENFLFQAAVPKTFKLQMQPPSGNNISPMNGSNVTQSMLILNPNKEPVRMLLRISYTLNGQPVQEQGQVDSFPAKLWGV